MTVGGFGARLMSFDFVILQDFGKVRMLNVVLALISSLMVLPPIVWVETKFPVWVRGDTIRRKYILK